MDYFREEWKPVVGFEGWYEVSSHGRVRRVRPGRNTRAGKILKPTVAKIGYETTYLSKGEGARLTRKRHYVHRLVAAAFIGPCRPGLTVNHIDADKLNNRPWNLEYVTQPENAKHAWRSDLCRRGEDRTHAKLTDEDVRVIRALRGKATARALGEKYGVSHTVIVNIQKRKAWRHIA